MKMSKKLNKLIWAATLSGVVLALGATAMAQTPDSSSTAPATPPDGQTTAKPAVAAPGTVAITAANAAALAAPYTGPKYTNHWEVYGGLLFMNGQAGQNTPVRYNMGGGEVMGTYWLGNRHGGPLSKIGLAADYRFGAGTTPTSPSVGAAYGLNRVLVMQSIQSGGIQYQGPKNRYAAIDLHVLGGGTYGIFNYAVTHYPGGSPVSACPTQVQVGENGTLGLYCNHIAPYGAVGGSIDFNQGAKIAVRLQPDLTFEHFGTETREFFSISMGVLYRFGKK
jgi:hypothetical protein